VTVETRVTRSSPVGFGLELPYVTVWSQLPHPPDHGISVNQREISQRRIALG
jgi:hypothetical protein